MNLLKLLIASLALLILSCKDAELKILEEASGKKSIVAIIEFKQNNPKSKYLDKADEEIKNIINWIDKQDYGEMKDARDGNIYKTILMRDENIWMAENLKYSTPKGSWCPFEKDEHCLQYGRLYNWKNAMKSCPEGWKLPTADDWWNMIHKYGGGGVAMFGIISGAPRNDNSDGRKAFWKLYKDTKFKIQLSGQRDTRFFSDEIYFRDAGKIGNYWTSTIIPEAKISYYKFFGDPGRVSEYSIKNTEYIGNSCRCIKIK